MSKAFAGVQALDGVDLALRAGEVTALMGENGAGKSTLLKVISGDHQPDAGRLELAGEPVTFAGPLDSRRAGVRVVAQEPEIIPDVSVLENIYVGGLPARGPLVDRRVLLERGRADLARLGFDRMLPLSSPGRRLSPAQRQIVEIVRCLIDEPAVICFDEPTSSLSDSETAVLFQIIARLKEQGRAVAYVSHRLPEIFQIADSVTVLRDGRFIASTPVSATTPAEVVRMMVGRDLSAMYSRNRQATGEVVLELDGLTTDDVRDVSLTVRSGEIVGLGGLVGAGRSELAMALMGDRPVRAGRILIDGRSRNFADPGRAIAAGIGLAPEERKADALVMARSVRENTSLAVLRSLSRVGFVDQGKERGLTRRYLEKLHVRTPSMETRVDNLSGGNQQKVVLARWLARDSRVLILDEPTRGVDVGAKAEIYAIIDELAAAGVAILLISSELPELLGLADRIVVMEAGRVTGCLGHDEATEEEILSLAMASQLHSADQQGGTS